MSTLQANPDENRPDDSAPAAPPLFTFRYVWRLLRRSIIIAVGSFVLLAGIVLLVTPGPAFVVIPIGLAILSLECAWAARLLKKSKAALRGEDNSRFGSFVRRLRGDEKKPSA